MPRNLQRVLCATNKLIVIDYASHATVGGLVALAANHAALTFHSYVVMAANYIRRQGNFKFDLRSDLELRIGTDIHTCGAHILRGS